MKIIASDYDGTINYQGKISDSDKEAIKRFRKAGHKFGIVTGRDVELSSWIRQENGFEFDFLICCTGAFIKNGDGDVLYVRKGKVDTFFSSIIEKALELKAGFFAVGDVLTKCFVDVLGKIPYDISKLNEFTHANCFFPNEELAEEFAQYLRNNYSDKISAHRNGCAVDMPPAHVSKVTGIYEYAKLFDNPEIYAVGDNVNDIPMVKEFNGYAVSNAVDALKSVAKHQCNRIADMIDELLRD
ncbi:MAG: HAD-IIB family hydrolase [Clostridia bacterium]|nr:HAD-IIB family hydrolase [Clostridia bacterium]